MKRFIILPVLLVFALSLSGLNYFLRNELAATGIVYFEHPTDNLDLNILYQPEFNAGHSFGTDFTLKGQAMGNALIRQVFRRGDDLYNQRGKIYRLWLAGNTTQTEARVGLQRINFGSAQLLRPLQWFDNLDPKDKLEQTEGVQALLLRHYFLNNTNAWLWGIKGQGKNRGQMLTVTKEDTYEMGGRLQIPLLEGEIALSYNHRFETAFQTVDTGSEDRLGLDLHVDPGIGLWLEGYISQTEKPFIIDKYQMPVTLGADYTFEIGNGIYTILETQMYASAKEDISELEKKNITLAFAANYPIGLLDKVLYYGAVKDDSSTSLHTLIWRREYDRLSWDVVFFWDMGKLYKSYDSRGAKLLMAYIF